MEIKVVSSDVDGAQLRRHKRSNPYHTRCTGKHDDDEISEAINHAGRGKVWFIASKAWERIFEGKK